MGVRGKGRGEALFKGFPSPLPPAAGGNKKGGAVNRSPFWIDCCFPPHAGARPRMRLSGLTQMKLRNQE